MSKQLLFVPTDGSAKIRPTERKLIRRHCMQDRNKQPGSRRSKREAARVVAATRHELEKRGRYRDYEGASSLSTGSTALCSDLLTGDGRRHASDDQSTVPPSPPSDWALFRFSEELDVHSQALMHQCT